MGFFQKNKTNKIMAKFIIVIILSISFIVLFQWKNVLAYKAADNIEITKLIDSIFENRK